jgi:CBS domain-containing protein
MAEITVADVMTKDIVAVAPDTDLATIAKLLTERRISGVPVVSGKGSAVGVVTLADLADPDRKPSEATAFPVFYQIEDGWAAPTVDSKEPRKGRAEDVMTPVAVSVESSTSLLEASRVMVEERIHRLLVVEDDLLVGIVSTLDLLRGYVQQQS